MNVEPGPSEVGTVSSDGSDQILDKQKDNCDETEACSQSVQPNSPTGNSQNLLEEPMTGIDTKGNGKKSPTPQISEILDDLVSNKEAHFKSQQRGEPDLSAEEKREIADRLFQRSPSRFLSRYGSLLSKPQLDYFQTFQYPNTREKDDVMYHLSHLGVSRHRSSRTKVRNRRYGALQKMVSNGSYFLLEEMQSRNPLLYEQLVGKYQTDEEKKAAAAKQEPPEDKELPLMQYFAKKVEKEQMEKFKKQQEMEEASDGYDDSDEGEMPQNGDSSPNAVDLWGEYKGKFQGETSKAPIKKKSKNKAGSFEVASEKEKEFYLQEFQAAMYHSFLTGNDRDFDYSTVDNNPDYDCVDMNERDEQDRYFDDESPDSGPSTSMDVAQDNPQEINESAATHSDVPKPVLENDNDDSMGTDAGDRLTEDDLQSLKSFASSWANDQTPSTSQINEVQEPSEQKMMNDHIEKLAKVTISSKVPVKKNHKIQIKLKTTEI